MSKSKTDTVWPIISAIRYAEKAVQNDNFHWNGGSNEQRQKFLKQYYSYRKELSLFNEEEISSIAAETAEEINAFLEEKGFDGRLEPFYQADGVTEYSFGVASLLTLLLSWQEKGNLSSVEYETDLYSAVRMNEQAGVCEVFHFDTHKEPVICLTTELGDKVYITVADMDQQDCSAEEQVSLVLAGERLQVNSYGDVVFPKISYHEPIDIFWLVDMKACVEGRITKLNGELFGDPIGNVARVLQAIQETKFNMDEVGAKVESVCAVEILAISGCCLNLTETKPTLVIDKPFLLWVERDGVSLPIFNAYFTTDAWQQLK